MQPVTGRVLTNSVPFLRLGVSVLLVGHVTCRVCHVSGMSRARLSGMSRVGHATCTLVGHVTCRACHVHACRACHVSGMSRARLSGMSRECWHVSCMLVP